VAIATLSLEEQEALRKHGHLDRLEIAAYEGLNGEPGSVTVECTQCGEVLVELIGGREQDS
jgi:hypothetical protein